MRTVILSGVRTSQSEVLPESKDPDYARTEMAWQGVSTMAAPVEFPGASLLIVTFKGFFDCVGVRFANSNFAQDDRM